MDGISKKELIKLYCNVMGLDASYSLYLKNHKKGEDIIFNSLYEEYKNIVSIIINRYVKEKDEIDLISNITFQKAFKKINSYNKDYRFSTWIARIARNSAIDYLRANVKRSEFQLFENNILDFFETESQQEIKHDLKRFEKLIAPLNTDNNYALFLVIKKKYIEDLMIEEISDQLRISVFDVEKKIQEAIKILRKYHGK